MSIIKKFSRMLSRTVCVALISLAIASPNFAQADPDAAPILLGKTMGEWSTNWWQWSLSIPAATNPMLDNSGAFCNVGQKGPVWFLAGVFFGGTAERNCTIPSGKHLLFPIANNIWINSGWDDPNNTEADYRQFANDSLPPSVGGDLEATLDGNPIIFNPKTPITRSQSPVFSVKFPADNVFGLDPTILTDFPIVSDGFWVMLPPLSKGTHVLHFRAGQSQDVTYHLTIQ